MLYVLFVVGGQFLILCGWYRGWCWTRRRGFRIAHLAAIGIVVLEALFDIWCPLTVWENDLRELGGQQTYELSFIGYWINRLLFYSAPDWMFDLTYSLFGLVVAVTFLLYPPDRR